MSTPATHYRFLPWVCLGVRRKWRKHFLSHLESCHSATVSPSHSPPLTIHRYLRVFAPAHQFNPRLSFTRTGWVFAPELPCCHGLHRNWSTPCQVSCLSLTMATAQKQRNMLGSHLHWRGQSTIFRSLKLVRVGRHGWSAVSSVPKSEDSRPEALRLKHTPSMLAGLCNMPRTMESMLTSLRELTPRLSRLLGNPPQPCLFS